VLSEKSGMERGKLVRVLKSKGLDEALVGDIIDELIMDGQCYESDSGVLIVLEK
jgi:hypothetical protein